MKQPLILMLVFVATCIAAQNFDQALIERLDSQIELYIEGISPGIAVGMVKDGEIVYQKYIGYANLEHEVPINEQTRFNIASNAKQYTALCVLKLIKEGRIGLEDDFRIYLSDFYPQIAYKITISHLLAHTSGIRDVYYLWGLKGLTWWRLFIDNDDAVELLQAQTDLNFTPGSDFLYSNSNYILLAELVKKVTKKDFSEFASELFQDLAMANTSFLTNYMAVVPNKARPYSNWNGWREYPQVTEIHGDGGLFTTLSDQMNWEQIIQSNNGNSIPKTIIDESQSPIITHSGYGLMFGNYKGLNYAYHNGNTGAYNATFLRFIGANLSIIVLSNNGNVPTYHLAKQLADISLHLEEVPEYRAEPETIEDLSSAQDILGKYKSTDGTIIKIVEKDGSLFRVIDQQEPTRLIPESGGLFHYESNADLKMNFVNIGEADQQLTIYLSSQEPATYSYLPNSDLDNFDKAELNGNFYNEETDTNIEIKFIDNNTYSVTKNGRERKAHLLAHDLLRTNSYEITIIRDEQGNTSGLNVKNDRIRNVIFNKY